MVERFARSLAAATAVGVVVQEGLWAGFGAIVAAGSLNQALAAGPASPSLWPPLASSWIAGGFAAGLMGTLVACRGAGHTAGALMSLSSWCLCWLAWPDAGGLLTAALMPSLGATLGTGLAMRLVAGEVERPLRPSVVTLPAPAS